MKRVKIKSKNPNPLFECWLKEWKEEAALRNSDLQYHFSKALSSLKKYPLPLKTGKDCIILQHFGKKLCLMLDRKLEEYKARNKDLIDIDSFVCEHCNVEEQHVPEKKCKSRKLLDTNYLHKKSELPIFDKLNLLEWNLENYAALLILYKKTEDPDYIGSTVELDLLFEMQDLCGHASKCSISNLFNNGLISMRGDPIRCNLTEQGMNLAKRICDIAIIDAKQINSSEILNQIQISLKLYINEKTNALTLNECSNSLKNNVTTKMYKSKSAEFQQINQKDKLQSDKHFIQEKPKKDNIAKEKVKQTTDTNNCELNSLAVTGNSVKNIHLQSNKYDIILLVDTHETCGSKTKPQHDATIAELTKLGVLFEIRHLKVGDFAWIARCRITNNELILPYIVERKRIDDLSASITDGRFHEQKFRLKQSGVTNLMYIIEEYGKEQRLAIPYSALMQASINTLIQDGFSVKHTKSHKDSMFYLSSLTRVFIQTFKDKDLISCEKGSAQSDHSSNIISLMEFEVFNKAASKQKVFKVKEMFIRQLLQLKGISVDKALAIVERYPTPRILIDAFQACDCNAELLLANIKFGNKKNLVGPTISKIIYQLYRKKNLQ